jgi:hypothetical protein
MTSIGYRYSYGKTLKSSVACVYYRIRDRAKIMCKELYDNIIEHRKNNNSLSMKEAYDLVINTIEMKNYMPKYDTVKQWIMKGFLDGRPDQVSRSFPKAKDFIELFGAEDIFKNETKKHSYSMTKEQTYLPTFKLKVVKIRDVGEKTVYDIEVKDTHSFLAENIVVHNCLQDSVLIIHLMRKMQTWCSLTEMATVCNVLPFMTYTSGQQIKVYSQVYKFCFNNDIVVEKDGYTAAENERYVGAHVFPPIPGVYDRVLPFDFASLYPTTIIAYNIDYSTLVLDENVPDSKCHVMKWEDHIGHMAN